MFRCLLVAVFIVCCRGAEARADWDPGDYSIMEYEFLPDLTSEGLDLNVSDMTLADDFTAELDSTVTQVHVWGAWLNDQLPGGDPANVIFQIGLHENAIVDGPYGPESKPGALIWYNWIWHDNGGYQEQYFTVREFAGGLSSTWLEPNDGQQTPNTADTCYQYNFYIEVNPPEIEMDEHYWLVVRAEPSDPAAKFGWKTTTGEFNGLSQWTWGGEPINNPESWVSIWLQGQISLAFIIAGPVPGDADGDGDVDLSDLAYLLGCYGLCAGDSGFPEFLDYDDSGCIDLSDLAMLLGFYGYGT